MENNSDKSKFIYLFTFFYKFRVVPGSPISTTNVCGTYWTNTPVLSALGFKKNKYCLMFSGSSVIEYWHSMG